MAQEKEQLSCDICENKFKSLANLTWHDQRFHLKQGTVNEFNCDFCNETYADKIMLCDHITNIHKKCTLCAKMFPNTDSLETHVLAVHKKNQNTKLKGILVWKITRTKEIINLISNWKHHILYRKTE